MCAASAVAESLPFVDEHSVEVAASPEATWEAVLRTTESSLASRRAEVGARLLGCEDAVGSGPRPLSSGSTIPGFRVEVADAQRELALVGRHRFSRYALIFRLDPDPGGVRLGAETRAEFPGLRGRAYRAMVIGTGMHVLVTRRLLEASRRRAERPAAG
ncbi:MAG TPA: hypothetical protein VHF50_05980 [Solirubrobacterales bacterium]|nr:hypothetical protein [Solirubrobacterales bacterium]